MTDGLQLGALEIRAGDRALVRHAALAVRAGEIVGLTGPSGAGKSLVLRALLGLVPSPLGVTRAELIVATGDARIRPYDATGGAREAAFRRIRGEVLGLVPQGARAALDPLRTVGAQVAASAALAGDRAGPHAWLERAGFADPKAVARLRPHELSGGMAQRVVIAQALARGSRLLLADEPTSGLDPVVRAGLLRTLADLARDGAGVLLVSHDLNALARISSRVIVMDAGATVEEATPAALLAGDLRSDAGRRLARAAAIASSRGAS